MDDDLRSLERQASQNDPDAMLRLYQIKKRAVADSADAYAAAEIAFRRGLLLEIVPDSLIDLLARLRFGPAVEVWKQKKKRIQNEITRKLLDDLGQVTTVKLIALVLKTGIEAESQALQMLQQNIFDPEEDSELRKDAYAAIDQIWNWQPGQKLPEANKKQIKAWIKAVTDKFDLVFERDSGIPMSGFLHNPEDSSKLRFLSYLEGIEMAYAGRLTNKTAIGYSREAYTIIHKFFYKLNSPRRVAALTETELSLLGTFVVPGLIDTLLIKGEKIEKVPALKQESPEYWKREITGRRFTVVTFPKPYIETTFSEIGDKIYEFDEILVWTADAKEALKRAEVIAKHFGIKFSKKNLRTNNYVQSAKELLEAGLEEHQVMQPGFRPKVTQSTLKSAEQILLCRAAFRGGKPEYLVDSRLDDLTEADKKLSKKEQAKATSDARAFARAVEQTGVKIIGKILFHEVGNLAINISDAVGVSFRIKSKDYNREIFDSLAKKYNGIYSSHVERLMGGF